MSLFIEINALLKDHETKKNDLINITNSGTKMCTR